MSDETAETSDDPNAISVWTALVASIVATVGCLAFAYAWDEIAMAVS